MNYDDSHELMRIFESIVQNDPELQMEEFGESDDNNKPLTWDEICSAVEGDLTNKKKVRDDVHSKNPNVKLHDGKPYVQGSSMKAKEIEGSKFYYGKEPKSVDEAVYFLWQITKLYCGQLKLPSGIDCSDMYVQQYVVDARKMASYISGRLMTSLDLDCGWSNNTTDSILKYCVEYMRQSKPRDPSKLIQVLQGNEDRCSSFKKSLDKSTRVNEDEGNAYEFARKVGYMGSRDGAEEWLNGYGKSYVEEFNVFLKIANGDEDKAADLKCRYHDIIDGYPAIWDGKDAKEHLADLAKELGNSPEAKELIAGAEKSFAAIDKGMNDYFATHDYTLD